MICGHCHSRNVAVAHVKNCSRGFAPDLEGRVRSIGTPRQPEPKPTLATRATEGEDIEGVYYLNGTYFKVVKGTNTGNWYAKSWNPEAEAWGYEGRRPLYTLTEEHRVTAEQAAQFGALTGQCVFCGRRLTDERSIAVGYGPTCAAREGLPWGEKELVPAESPYPEAPEWTI